MDFMSSYWEYFALIVLVFSIIVFFFDRILLSKSYSFFVYEKENGTNT